MSSAAVPAGNTADKLKKDWMKWAGWAISLWPTFVVCWSCYSKLTHSATYVNEFTRIGWPVYALELLAFLQLGALILFLIPRTAVLGAIILAGYLGGAIASYVRIWEFYPPFVPGSTAVIAWLGLWMREPRLRQLLPIVRKASD